MTYCTLTDLTDVFGETEILQLADRDASGEADAEYLAAVLAKVDAEIDSYLRGRYALPLASVPTELTAIAVDLARYRLYPLNVPDTVQKLRDDALRWLRDLAAGRAELNLATEPEPVAVGIAASAPDRTFDATTLADF